MFEIFLDDKVNNKYTQLDCKGIDFTAIFSIADITDISKRKDSITKDIDLAGTATNNIALGHAYHTNKDIDELNISNTLFFNYNPQQLVDCYVYENSIQIMKGSLRLKSVDIKNGNVTYKVNITGKLIDFNSLIGDTSELSQLNISDLAHDYTFENIAGTWNNPNMAYLYPIINFGNPFSFDGAGNEINLKNQINPLNVKNLRPSLYVREIFKRIFAATPFTFEVKGSTQFKDYFNSLFIPDNSLGLYKTLDYSGGSKHIQFSLKAAQTATNRILAGGSTYYQPLAFNYSGVVFQQISLAWPYSGTDIEGISGTVWAVNKPFEASAIVNYSISYMNKNGQNKPITLTFEIQERKAIGYSDPQYNRLDNWDMIASESFVATTTNGSYVTKAGSIKIANRNWDGNTQLTCKIVEEIQNGTGGELSLSNFNYSLNQFDYLIPGDDDRTFKMNTLIGDSIVPRLPLGIKQLEFLQSIRNLFNLYVTVNPDTNVVSFEQYDSFYSKTVQPKETALDWTNKIDLSNRSFETNISIPKVYDFKFKNDVDTINETYQKKWNKSYGDYSVVDSKGIVDKKTVEILFSPSPLVTVAPNKDAQANFSLDIPWIYKVDGLKIIPTESNIRIMSRSGYQNNVITLLQENYLGGFAFFTNYVHSNPPRTCNYYYDSSNNPVYDIHFGTPNQVFFNKTSAYDTVKTGYNHYARQIVELQNPNITYHTLEAYLTPEDINRLDFSVPIFLDFGTFGHSYFKLLKVDYKDSLSTSTIELQKIVFIDDKVDVIPCVFYNLYNSSSTSNVVSYTSCEGVASSVTLSGKQSRFLYSRTYPVTAPQVIIG